MHIVCGSVTVCACEATSQAKDSCLTTNGQACAIQLCVLRHPTKTGGWVDASHLSFDEIREDTWWRRRFSRKSRETSEVTNKTSTLLYRLDVYALVSDVI